MYYKLYIDSVFFIQFVMNLCLLSITGKILKCTATHLRIIFGALLGAVIICLVILLPLFNMKIRLIIGAIPVSMIMIRVVFKVHTPRLLIKSCMVMAFYSFLLGSIVLWLDSRFAWPVWLRYSIRTFVLFIFFGYGIIVFLIRKFQKEKTDELKEIRIPIDGHNVHMKALLDTGNHLAEPVSGAPVCILSESAAKELQAYFIPEKYHAIPFRSVGKSSGIMDAYELPELVIKDTYRDICCKRVIVAICNTGISKDSIYQMILHPGLIEN